MSFDIAKHEFNIVLFLSVFKCKKTHLSVSLIKFRQLISLKNQNKQLKRPKKADCKKTCPAGFLRVPPGFSRFLPVLPVKWRFLYLRLLHIRIMSSSSLLSRARERSRVRKELLKSTLGVEDLASALGEKRTSPAGASRAAIAAGSSRAGLLPDQDVDPEDRRNRGASSESFEEDVKRARRDGSVRSSRDSSDTGDGGQEFRDSTAFLKGTQSMNPHNDYSQNFVDTGQRPQNFIRDVGLADRFEEYPKLRELIKLKNDLVAERAHPPMYLKCDLEVIRIS